MADSIDSIVKGAPRPGQEAKPVPTGTSPIASSTKPGDPLSHTPSSPSMIYLNMLILEASLRAQYLELRTRRRKHTFFLSLLCIWLAFFGYALFFAPREDGVGVGGSVYWVVDMVEKVGFISGVVTALLVWATGIWDRGIRWPRRWFGISNRGLRGFNCKLVVIKRSWWVETVSTIGFFFTYGAVSSKAGQYRAVDPAVLREVEKQLNLTRLEHPPISSSIGDEEKRGLQEDLAPGGDYVKLLFMPKPFSANFRENWELYRNDYWERENERRALLRARLKQRDREQAKQDSRWFWWLPWRRRMEDRLHVTLPGDHEKTPHQRSSAILREHRRGTSSSVRRGSASAGSSRSATPTIELDEAAALNGRGSPAASAADRRRKKKPNPASGPRSIRGRGETRSLTPEIPSPLARSSSAASGSGSESVRRSPRQQPSRSSTTSS